MSFCKAPTLTEGFDKGPDVNAGGEFAENFTPGELSIQDLRLDDVMTRRLV
jgi:hypothetical protein